MNMTAIISKYPADDLVIIVSAMGKTTNQLEEIVFTRSNHQAYKEAFEVCKVYHKEIVEALFSEFAPKILTKLDVLFHQILNIIGSESIVEDQNKFYDAVVSYGEIISSTIISEYLNHLKIKNRWTDARKIIKTDGSFREARVNWEITCQNILDFMHFGGKRRIYLTQGFIGSSENDHITTLGREGSDFTAAIFAACLNAESVTIWKDVPGILNADPKRFSDTQLYQNISYQEAAEMTYYGASVIHPKTIKPLANRRIPLYVKSFENPDLNGTLINEVNMYDLPPAYVVKENQCLISFQVRDLDFINEKSLSIIFHVLDLLNIKLNMMQNSAVSFTCCVDNNPSKINKLLNTLQNDFKIRYNDRLLLFTVKNYNEEAIRKISHKKDILVEQRTRHTYQIVVR